MAFKTFIINKTLSVKIANAAKRGMSAAQIARIIGCRDVARIQTWVDEHGKDAPAYTEPGKILSPEVQALMEKVEKLEARVAELTPADELDQEEDLEAPEEEVEVE